MTAPPPRRPTPIIVLVLVIGGIGLALFCVLVGALMLRGGGRARPSSGLTVEYRVGGSTKGASVTIQTGQGTQEQDEVSVPWSRTLTAPRSGQFVYVAAQNQGDVGDVTCSIVVNGAVWKEARSGADYGIASCSGALP